MSLNRSEQLLWDYVEKHPDERQFWMHKVRQVTDLCADPYQASQRLDAELWAYFQERATVVPALKEFARPESGSPRVSMRNLAEYVMRLWIAPKPKRSQAAGPGA